MAFAISLAAIFMLLAPAIVRTLHLASSADGLLLLSDLSEEDLSLNPWSKDCYLIWSGAAAAILTTFDWPYNRRSAIFRDYEPAPLIHQVISARGMGGRPEDPPFGSEEDFRRMVLLRHFVTKGYSIDESSTGLAPIHLAQLIGDIEVVRYLVEQDADLELRIVSPGRKYHGMNSLEFSQLLIATSQGDYRDIAAQAIAEILAAATNE